MPKVDDILKLLVSTLMKRKSFDEELLCIMAEIIEDRPIAEADCCQLAFEINLDLSDLKTDLINYFPIEGFFISELDSQRFTNDDNINHILYLFNQLSIFWHHDCQQLFSWTDIPDTQR